MGILAEDIEARFEAYGSVIAEREDRILGFLSQERTLEEMIDQPLIYGEHPFAAELLRRWEENMLRKHLQRLTERGLVEETDRGYVRVPGAGV
jgi:hypothetical protein